MYLLNHSFGEGGGYMKKVISAFIIIILILIGVFIYVKSGSTPDKEYHQEVVEKVETYVKNKYPEKEIIAIKPVYYNKFKEKNKKYQVAVKYASKPDWFESYYLKEGQVVRSHAFQE